MTPRRRPERERSLPARPYRDSAILNGVLAVAIVGFALLTGGDLGVAVLVAIAFFVVATAWSWWRFRQRIAEQAEGTESRSR